MRPSWRGLDRVTLHNKAGSGQTQNPKQVSTIFRADLDFGLSDKLTFDTRCAYRGGKVPLGRNSDKFMRLVAPLAVLRVDRNVLRKSDFLAEEGALDTLKANFYKIE